MSLKEYYQFSSNKLITKASQGNQGVFCDQPLKGLCRSIFLLPLCTDFAIQQKCNNDRSLLF